MIETGQPAARRTVLLLGGTGFLGRNIAAELNRAEHKVIVAARRHAPSGATSSLVLPMSEVDAILELVQDRGVDTVVHLASTMIPSSGQEDFLAEQAAIVCPTMRLAAGLTERSVDLVYVSSGGTIYGATQHVPVAEDAPCAPISFYGQAKLGLELYLEFLHRTQGLRHLIVRPSNPFGRGQALEGPQGLISVILGKIRDGRPLEIWGDGSSVRDYIHVDDLALSIRELIEQGVRGTTVNIGSGTGYSLLEVVQLVEHATGQQVKLRFNPPRSADVLRLILDITRLRAWGMDHARPLERGIRDYVAELGMLHG